MACVILIGAAAIFWYAHKALVDRQKLAAQVKLLQQRANQGDAQAEYDLGRMYYWGRGVPRDYAQANYWHQKAAAQGLAKAECAIGGLYYYGRGLDQSYADALVWYRKAADQGDAEAQDALGSMSYYGRGMPQNYSEAFVWYKKSASQGYAEAEFDIGYLYSYGLGVARDREEANRWYRKAASQGNQDAQRALGLRLYPLRPGTVFFNILILVFCLLLIWDDLAPKRLRRSRNSRKLVIAAIPCFITIGMFLFEHSRYCLFPSVWAAFVYRFIHLFASGVVVTLFVTALKPRAGKILLIISGILIAGINFGLFAFAHFDLRALSIIGWSLLRCDAGLIGMAISATFFWWRAKKEPEDDASEAPPEEADATEPV